MRTPWAPLAASLPIAICLLLLPGGLCGEIIGGKEVTPHSRPYMVLLKLDNITCAGALIDENWVLTAAHCKLNERAKVILGAHSLSKNETEKKEMGVEKLFSYPCYDPETHQGDLCLLKLHRKATINKNVAILHLPKSGQDVKPGTMCQVAGWGLVNNTSETASETLREVNVTVIDRKTCNDPQHYNYDPVIGLNMVCAGDRKGGKDSCTGDSGSPLICEGTFRGVTSSGRKGKCGDPHSPGVYMLLTKKYLNWINKTTKEAV